MGSNSREWCSFPDLRFLKAMMLVFGGCMEKVAKSGGRKICGDVYVDKVLYVHCMYHYYAMLLLLYCWYFFHAIPILTTNAK